MSGWLKGQADKLAWRYRHATAHRRPLPGAVVIGAQKAGTTSLYACLKQHPQLLASYTKEVHFFDGGLDRDVDNHALGPAWYRAHFPLAHDGQVAFEASPLYIFNPLVPRRMAGLIPEARLILMLRNPTERAISHYFHARRIGREPLGIMDALLNEEERLAPVLTNRDYKSDVFIHNSYQSRGRYRQQIERFLGHFPREQLLVLGSEEFFRDPERTLEQVFSFMGVAPECRIADLKPHNTARNRDRVEPEVYRHLDDHFQPHNQALYELLGRDFGW